MSITKRTQTVTKILNVGLFRFVYQDIARVRFVASFPICETKPVFDMLKWRRRLFTSLRALSAGSRVHSVNDIEASRNLQQRVEDKGPRLGDSFLHRQHTNNMVANSQMIALRLDVGIDDLIVEKLRALWIARNPPVRRS